VVEEAKEKPAVSMTIIELPTNIEPQERDEVTPKQTREEEVIEKIIGEEKPSAPIEEKTTTIEVVEVKKDVEEEEEKPLTQSLLCALMHFSLELAYV
jgi:hypothetical protein